MNGIHRVAIAADTFDQLRFDADLVLNKLLKNMAEKGTHEGSVTIKIDVLLTEEFGPKETDDGTARRIIKPKFEHKINSVMQIKDSKSGTSYSDLMELVWDDERKEYVLAPIKEGRQMTIFDMDQQEEEPIEEVKQIEAREVLALPEPDDEDESENDEDESENDEDGDEGDGVGSRAAFEKARKKFSGMNDPDDYEYEDPETEEDEE